MSLLKISFNLKFIFILFFVAFDLAKFKALIELSHPSTVLFLICFFNTKAIRPEPVPISKILISINKKRLLFPLPLPSSSKSVPTSANLKNRRSQLKKQHVESLTGEVVGGLNRLMGLESPCLAAHAVANEAQRSALQHISRCVAEFGAPDPKLSPARCLSDICSDSATYAQDRVVSCLYDEKSVSWPPTGAQAASALEHLSGEPLSLLRDWQSRLLRPPF